MAESGNELMDFLKTKSQPSPEFQKAVETGTLTSRETDMQTIANQALINKVNNARALNTKQVQNLYKQNEAPAKPYDEKKSYLGTPQVAKLVDAAAGVKQQVQEAPLTEAQAEASVPMDKQTGIEILEELLNVSKQDKVEDKTTVSEEANTKETTTEPQEVSGNIEGDDAGEQQTDTEEATEDTTQEESDKEVNFKQLRQTVKEFKTNLKEREKELEEIKAKVTKYETGEELPEVIKPLQQRVAELEKYEKLHALKTSPAYKEAFEKPIQELSQKIKAIGQDYGIPDSVMAKAEAITNRAELNRFLSNHFDDVGALEVKQLITQQQQVRERAAHAEQEPAQVLQQIEQEYAALQQSKRAHNQQIIASASRDAWVEALQEVQREGKALELIYKPADTEHNQKYVEPIVGKAATEYGKIVKLLADNGLESMPKELAKAMAKMVQLAHASAVAIETRAAAEREMEELKANTTRRTNYLRPNTIGSGVNKAPNTEAKPPASLKEAANRILESIGVRT